MLIQKIQGGLGNQMFQYAFIKALSLRNKVDFKLDISEYKTYFRPYELEIFNIEKKYANKNEIPFYETKKIKNRYFLYINVFIKSFFSKINKNHYIEREETFELDFLNKNFGYFEGYFENEKYFKDFEFYIKKDFTCSKPLSQDSSNLLKYMKGKNTISVHIRRGDYLKHPNHHPILSLEFYNKAINHIKSKVNSPIFLFFSDDIERVKKEITGDNYMYININKGNDSWQDMILMSECEHNIIANSTFSRRGAWLNKNKDKIVIAPKKRSNGKAFNRDIVPSSRIKF